MPFSFHLMAILALFFCPLHYKEKIVKCPKFLTARSDSYYSVTRLGDFYKVLVDKFFLLLLAEPSQDVFLPPHIP